MIYAKERLSIMFIMIYETNINRKICQLQAQANLLKSLALTSTTTTTIITVGIGIDISLEELRRLASGPGNSILLPNLGNMTLLPSDSQQLINIIYGKKPNIN